MCVRGCWPKNIHHENRRAYTLVDIKRWLEVFLFRFFVSASLSVPRCQMVRKFRPVVRCRRAAIGAPLLTATAEFG
jgi:hypothetical protein